MPIVAEEDGTMSSLLARLNKLEAEAVTKDKALLEAQTATLAPGVAGSSGTAPTAAAAPVAAAVSGPASKRARTS